MNKEYIVVIRTGEAEIRATQNTKKETLEKIFPIIRRCEYIKKRFRILDKLSFTLKF